MMNMTDDMMKMDDTMSMDMSMTFTSWDEYKVKILFTTWNVQEKWQFALSWFTVVLAVVVFHAVRAIIVEIEVAIKGARTSETMRTPLLASPKSPLINDSAVSMEKGLLLYWCNRLLAWLCSLPLFQLRIIHAVATGLNYGMSLMLMLIAMTFNPSLFLALVLGYILGDYIFYSIRQFPKFKKSSEPSDSDAESSHPKVVRLSIGDDSPACH